MSPVFGLKLAEWQHTCHMRSHSVTYHPTEVTFPPLPQPKIKRPRSWLVTYRHTYRPKTVTHPGTNRARRALTSFMRRTPLTTTPRRQPSVVRDVARLVAKVRAELRAWHVLDAGFVLHEAKRVAEYVAAVVKVFGRERIGVMSVV